MLLWNEKLLNINDKDNFIEEEEEVEEEINIIKMNKINQKKIAKKRKEINYILGTKSNLLYSI